MSQNNDTSFRAINRNSTTNWLFWIGKKPTILEWPLSTVLALLVSAVLARCTAQWLLNLEILALITIVLEWKTLCFQINQAIPSQAYIYALAVFSLQVVFNLARNNIPLKSPNETRSEALLRPMLYECKTTHTRLFPSKHSFAYSYLLVRVPVGADVVSNALLSADTGHGKKSQTWFSVNSEDYLERGEHQYGLLGKLKDYLSSMNVDVDMYPYAILVTAPRFLGFSVNPVSFWHLYDKNKSLQAMILEVNNTFGERRMYFTKLQRDNHIPSTITTAYSSEWQKDFHVSPFNDRDGSYSVTAIDPLHANESNLDVTIVLKADNGKTKIVAQVFSITPGIDATKLSSLQALAFICRWWWVGFVTNPRVLREARILWMKKLQVYYRPEVLRTSIGRDESKEESRLEPCFRILLNELANNTQCTISYIPAAGPERAKQILVVPVAGNATRTDILEIKILTPAFYGEIPKKSTVFELFECFSFSPEPGQAMIHTSNAGMFREMIETFSHQTCPGKQTRVRSRFNNMLRRRQSQSSLSPKVGLQIDDFMNANLDQSMLTTYEKSSTVVLLADRVALGMPAVLRFYVSLIRYGILYLIAQQLLRLLRDAEMPFIEVVSLPLKLIFLGLLDTFIVGN